MKKILISIISQHKYKPFNMVYHNERQKEVQPQKDKFSFKLRWKKLFQFSLNWSAFKAYDSHFSHAILIKHMTFIFIF
jgi:hypothetical protein